MAQLCKNLDRTLDISQQRQFSILSSLRIVLNQKKHQGQRKNMPQIILKERAAHLGSYTFFKRDVDQYKNTSLSQLYQPPRTASSQNTYHWLLSFCEYYKVFKNSFYYKTPPETVVCRYSSKQVFLKVLQTSQESHCVGVSF